MAPTSKFGKDDGLERLVREYGINVSELRKLKGSLTTSGFGREERQMVYDYFSICEEMIELGDPQMALLYIEEYEKLKDEKNREKFSRLDERRQNLEYRVESILEFCINDILEKKRLSPKIRLKLIYPFPVDFNVSMRDKIAVIKSKVLDGRIDIDTVETIESGYQEMNLAAHISPLGGLAGSPILVLGLGLLKSRLKTMLHETGHELIGDSPLRLYSILFPELKAIQEITCDIVKEELVEDVIQEYFQDYTPSALVEKKEGRGRNFWRRTKESINAVNEYLSHGDVTGAERYLEEIRGSQGFRVFNQATLSAHGFYSNTGNPMEAKVCSLRESSKDLYTFLEKVSKVKTVQDFENLLLALD